MKCTELSDLNEENESNLKQIKNDFLKVLYDIKNYIKAYQKITPIKFDENRINSVKEAISRITSYEEGQLEYIPKNKIMWNQYINKMKYDCEIISQFANEPLSIFPDLNLWLFNGDEAIGLCSIKSHNIIWSNTEDERGSLCGKLLYTDIKVNIQLFYLNKT